MPGRLAGTRHASLRSVSLFGQEALLEVSYLLSSLEDQARPPHGAAPETWSRAHRHLQALAIEAAAAGEEWLGSQLSAFAFLIKDEHGEGTRVEWALQRFEASSKQPHVRLEGARIAAEALQELRTLTQPPRP